MTLYLGQFLLNLAALFAVAPLVWPFSLKVIKKTYLLHTLLMVTALGWLIGAHLTDNFSLLNVVHHSHTQKPWFYKLAGTWGNHEGSMLLWVVLLAIFGLSSFAKFPDQTIQRTRFILHSSLNFLFTCFLILACDPFEVCAVTPAEGLDLNPLLQDPLLAIHPPFLYAGYVGFAVPFIYILSVLSHHYPSEKWIMPLRPLVLKAWTFLSIGLGLGCFWAYYELGWGGWWFWDPVENMALIPWLLGLMLIHSLLKQAHEQKTVMWVIFLSFSTFIASLLGTLLVRSGALVSVHSFAVDPARSILLAGMIAGITISSFLLILKHLPSLKVERDINFSQSQSIRVALMVTAVALFTLAFGTLYPVVSSALGYPITVGAPYFQMTFIPMLLPALVLLGSIPHLAWFQEKKDVFYKFLPSITLSGLSVVLLWFLGKVLSLKEILFSWVSLWIMVSTLRGLKGRRLTQKRLGATFAHFGMGLAILGMVLSAAKEQEMVKPLKIGESFQIASYQMTLEKVEMIPGSNYMAQQAFISISEKGTKKATLKPEKRFYWTKGLIHGETAIYTGITSHVYIALGEEYEGNIWSVRAYYKPFINLLWIGMICIAIGGIVLLVGRKKNLQTLSLFLLFSLQSTIAMEAHEVLPNPLLEQRAMHIGKMILCPTCAGQNINDSVAEEAQQMRQQVRSFLLQGASDSEILETFVKGFGEKILYQPSFGGINLFLWGVPWVIFIGWGSWFLWSFIRLRRQR